MIILYIIVGIIAFVFVAALIMPKEHYVEREVVIEAPRQKVFDFIRFLQNQESFNTNAMEDANREKTFKGTDGTVGYIYSWKGNKNAGEGEKEIIDIVDPKRGNGNPFCQTHESYRTDHHVNQSSGREPNQTNLEQRRQFICSYQPIYSENEKTCGQGYGQEPGHLKVQARKLRLAQ